ncbi:hypothetical protein MUP59_02920, partial [Candidatus Bathyarchaeota archaeon]|nr:hypothetical protein [Candidatus Bathyarchaeota archaeon]
GNTITLRASTLIVATSLQISCIKRIESKFADSSQGFNQDQIEIMVMRKKVDLILLYEVFT